MYQVSPSGIGFLKECPRCLWLYYNEGVKRPRGIFPSLPSGMDNVLKDYFDEYRLKGSLPPELNGKIKEKLYPDLAKLKKMRQIFQGLVFEFPKLNIRLKGAIDDLLLNDKNRHVVFDFKTRGYPIKENTHVHYQDQLNLYALLLEKNGLISADYGYLFFIHPITYAEGKAEFISELVKMKISWKDGLATLKKVKKILVGPKPKAHTKCEFCLYRSSRTMFD